MKYIKLIIAFVMVPGFVCAQTFDYAWATRFQTVLDSARQAGGFKGASAAVLVPGQGIWEGVSGLSSPGVPVTPDMRFGIGSNTKLFIAVVMQKLCEEGVLSLEDQVHQWLPDYTYVDPSITIRQLLSHQSGLYDYINDHYVLITDSVWADPNRIWTHDEILATIGPPHFTPGVEFYYSNTDYVLAARIIEAATGETWVQNLHRYIFDPLHMNSTFVGALETPNGPVAHEWYFIDNSEIVNSPMPSLFSVFNAAGGILSTAKEMVQWYDAFFYKDLLADTSLEDILHIEPTSLYGLGMQVGPVNQLFYTHTGRVVGYESVIVHDPKTRSSLIVMVNGGPPLQTIPRLFFPLLNVLTSQYPRQQNDAGINAVISPKENTCSSTINPLVTLKNFGSDTLTMVTIHYQIDEEIPGTFIWTGILNAGSSRNVSLPAVDVSNGSHLLRCYTSAPNGSQEGYSWNDTIKSEFIVNIDPAPMAPFMENFEGPVFPPIGWVTNSYSTLHWNKTYLSPHQGKYCLVKGNYYDSGTGVNYDLDLPGIDITGINHPAVEFDYAYANYPGRNDILRVQISTDCGVTWQNLFNKGGAALSTAGSSTELYYPENGDWKHESISLASFTGEIYIRLRVINGNGNNLFIDDISINSSTVGINELASGENKILLFPNPTSDRIHAEGIPIGSKIVFTDIAGKILFSKMMDSPSTEIDLTDFPPGTYFVTSTFGVGQLIKL